MARVGIAFNKLIFCVLMILIENSQENSKQDFTETNDDYKSKLLKVCRYLLQ